MIIWIRYYNKKRSAKAKTWKSQKDMRDAKQNTKQPPSMLFVWYGENIINTRTAVFTHHL